MRGAEYCRSCSALLRSPVLSLGNQPLSNSLPEIMKKTKPKTHPLDFRICDNCSLGQVGEFSTPTEIFGEYTYFSSISDTWLNHSKQFAHYIVQTLALNNRDLVLEIASNDGYLLKFFQNLEVSVLGIEPALNVAEIAISNKVPTINKFFDKQLSSRSHCKKYNTKDSDLQ